MFKEYKLPLNSFIGGWFISKKTCDNLINYFNKNKKFTNPGIFGDQKNGVRQWNVKKEIKDSVDLTIDKLNTKKEIYKYRVDLQKVLNLYQNKYKYVKEIAKFNVEAFNIQKYPKKGGYKKWHTERVNLESSKRVLTFMTYLNNVKDGGTEFKYQKITTPALKGLTLIWPVDFTHIHRSQVCNEEKIITTGWYHYL